MSKKLPKDNLEEVLDQSYVDIIELHQLYLAEAQSLIKGLIADKPKTGTPHASWIKNYTELGRLVVNLVKEGRALEKDREVTKDMSDEQLIEEFRPLLTKLGWSAPKKIGGNNDV